MKYPEIMLVAVVTLLVGCDKVELKVADDKSMEWDSLRGDWVLVNYWAEWCKPCLEEIPELNALDQSDNITVLGVNFDGIEGQELVELGQKMDIEFTMLAEDPGPTFGWTVPVALPATFIVDPQGELLEARFGPQTEEQLLDLIQSQ
ncbi:TlpA disulfide reductase family protein [Marinobacter salicampi]|uniref:TlpA disulfide reductase family protein n=1 Tax=Marinobacter salicampi TaxID=435907 RepID=UPI003BF8BD7A